ncbi:MAG: Hsp20/alpha crystallin family protein [Bacteroidales bacterium]
MVLIQPNYRFGFPHREGPYFHENEEKDCRCNPASNIVKFDDHAEIHLFVPGREKKDFSINLDNEVLTISAPAHASEENSTGDFIQKEFVLGEFDRNFQVSEIIDAENIKASYEAGILKIELPFREEQRPKKRDIKIL